MINIFDYIDFSDYLKHYRMEARKKHHHFSYRLLAEKAGFSGRWVLYRILAKKAKLSMAYCARLSKALNHTKREAEYFSLIVAYAQQSNTAERSDMLKKAMEIKTAAPEPQMIGKNHIGYFSEWYHSVVRAIIGIGNFNEDYTLLCGNLALPITEAQARRSVNLLERIGFVERDETGKYRIITAKFIKTNNEFTREDKNRVHREFMDIARELLSDNSSATQKVSSQVLGISEETYEIICRETDDLKARIRTLVENETRADRVVLYQSILVPLTKNAATGNPGV